jgi:tetratricopeptide (TPR) repeat protein
MKENNNIPEKKSSKLVNDLTKYKDEGCALYKEKKIVEATNKFMQGSRQFEDEISGLKKDSLNDNEYNEIILLGKKILSNLALCFYKQGNYPQAIFYDLKLLKNHPNFGKSIVRLFKSSIKLNKIKLAVEYGELFLKLDEETRNKFKGTENQIKEAQLKLKKIEKEEEKAKSGLGKYFLPFVILCIAVLGYYLLKKK